MRLTGWGDWRFYWTSEFLNFLRNPRSTALSVPWDHAISKLPALESFQCYQLNGLGPDQAAMKDLWAYMILNRREREAWQNLKGPEARKAEWLSAKLVAKDAVRMFLKKRHAVDLYPADIEIATDEHGRPVPQVAWTKDLQTVPAVSLAHTNGLAVALVGYCPSDQRIGIDVELISQHTPGFETLSFANQEQSLLRSLDESNRQEWMTRIWCAKEAVAKALGHGLIEGPRSLVVQHLNTRTGVTYMSLGKKLAKMFPDFANARIVAYTVRDENYIVATTLCERG
jgi:phosphopantetheinyl transferase